MPPDAVELASVRLPTWAVPVTTRPARRMCQSRPPGARGRRLDGGNGSGRGLVTVAGPPGRLGPGVAGYRASFARLGFTASDIDALNDELVGRLAAWGSTATITAPINEYRHAVSDQVALTVLDTGHHPVTDPARQLARRLLS
jgi:hypothetical protein